MRGQLPEGEGDLIPDGVAPPHGRVHENDRAPPFLEAVEQFALEAGRAGQPSMQQLAVVTDDIPAVGVHRSVIAAASRCEKSASDIGAECTFTREQESVQISGRSDEAERAAPTPRVRARFNALLPADWP